MTQPHAAQTPVFIAPDAFVLQGHELREGIELATTSRFGDDVWDLYPINHQDQLVRNILNFPPLPEQYRAVTKELFYAMLVGELPPGEVRLKQSSIRSAFTHVKKFLDWAHARPPHAGVDHPGGLPRISPVVAQHVFGPVTARHATA